MDLVDRLRAWSYRRQRLGGVARTPAQGLGAVVGVYGTHPTAPLSLAARVRGMKPGVFRALDRGRTAVRIPAMRTSVFLVPRATAPRVFAATRPPSKVIERRMRSIGLSLAEYEDLARTVPAAAREPVEQRALEAATGLKGAPLARLVRTLRMDGRLLSISGDSLRAGDLLYVATADWMPEGLEGDDPQSALAWLAGEYLRGFGPARREDFAWWAGVSQRAAASALAGHELLEVGGGLLLPAADEAAFSRVRRPRGAVDLLPKWDAYTMGYAPDGRARLVHPDVQSRLYTTRTDGSPGATTGDAYPAVLVDGVVAGTWQLTVKEGFKLDLFAPLPAATRRRLDERREEVEILLRG